MPLCPGGLLLSSEDRCLLGRGKTFIFTPEIDSFFFILPRSLDVPLACSIFEASPCLRGIILLVRVKRELLPGALSLTAYNFSILQNVWKYEVRDFDSSVSGRTRAEHVGEGGVRPFLR